MIAIFALMSVILLDQRSLDSSPTVKSYNTRIRSSSFLSDRSSSGGWYVPLSRRCSV